MDTDTQTQPPKSEETEWERIGEVGVDSGQLLITDPCYLLSQWKGEGEEKPKKAPAYRHKDGTILYCTLHGAAPVADAVGFDHYEQTIKKYDKTANGLNASGDMKHIELSGPSGEFSYTGCCDATLSKEQAGQLNYEAGHPGVGVVSSTGFGDGCYPVYARFVDVKDWGRRVAELRVVMIDEEDL